jgi:hypothetical protein
MRVFRCGMQTALSLLSLLALPFVRAYEAARDTVDAFWHFFLNAEEEINPTPQDPTVWHRRQERWRVKTIEGGRSQYVWRRMRPDGKWEYTERAMTKEEAEAEADMSIW